MTEEKFYRLARKIRRELRSKGYINNPIRYIELKPVKGYMGKCKRIIENGEFTFGLTFSDEILKVERHLIVATILHEFIHTIDNCFNHKKEFKRYAKIIGDEYKVNISTKFDIGDAPGLDERTKYILQCLGCGIEAKYLKKSRAVKNPEKFKCGKCGGDLIRTK